jgi:ferric-dicitrate binding protein FerR (iron transport regulator)
MSTEEQETQDAERAARLLGSLPSRSPAAEARVRARVLAARSPSLGDRSLRLVALAAGTAAIAAAALFAVRISLAPAPEAPVALAAALESTAGWGTHAGIPYVALSYEGSGVISGSHSAPHIAWDAGTINVEVAEGRGIALQVQTREANVRVVGTGFSVARGPLGTEVAVRHGRVEVDCGTELTRVLDAGDEVTCHPRSGAGLLGRARALQAASGPSKEVLETLDRGLALPDTTPAVVDELTASRIRVLVALSRNIEALAAARAYLAGPTGARRRDVELLGGTAAMNLGGCAAAAPWLLEMAPEACAP